MVPSLSSATASDRKIRVIYNATGLTKCVVRQHCATAGRIFAHGLAQRLPLCHQPSTCWPHCGLFATKKCTPIIRQKCTAYRRLVITAAVITAAIRGPTLRFLSKNISTPKRQFQQTAFSGLFRRQTRWQSLAPARQQLRAGQQNCPIVKQTRIFSAIQQNSEANNLLITFTKRKNEKNFSEKILDCFISQRNTYVTSTSSLHAFGRLSVLYIMTFPRAETENSLNNYQLLSDDRQHER